MTVKIDLEKLIETGAHFGHQKRRWNPKIKKYIHGVQGGVHIFDLTKTKSALEEAFGVLEKHSKEGKKILFVGTKKQAKAKIEEIAKETGNFYVIERWLGGTLTNFDQILKTLKELNDLIEKKKIDGFQEFTKKERLLLDRKIERTKRFFGGLEGITEVPELMVVVDVKREIGAIKEARKKGVTVIGIVDSNSSPDEVDYPIPMNDDATKAVDYVLELIKEVVLKSKNKKK